MLEAEIIKEESYSLLDPNHNAYSPIQQEAIRQLGFGYTRCILIHEGISLTLSLLLLSYIAVEVQHNFILSIVAIVTILQFFAAAKLIANRHQWTFEEFQFFKRTRARDIFAALSPSVSGKLPVLTWRSSKILIALLITLGYIVPLGLYIDWGEAPSSCTSSFSQTIPYNPHGFFNDERKPVNGLQYVGRFCTMYQRYALPELGTAHRFVSYKEPVTKSFCPQQSSVQALAPNPLNGYPNLITPPNCGPVTSDLSIGLCANASSISTCLPPAVTGQSPQQRFCPSSADSTPFCLNPDTKEISTPPCTKKGFVPTTGLPVPICSQCLNYHRWISGNYLGPYEYEHCAEYDSNEASSPFCAFCPGLGYGAFATACFSKGCIELLFIFYTIYISIWVLDVLFLLPIHLYAFTNQFVVKAEQSKDQ